MRHPTHPSENDQSLSRNNKQAHTATRYTLGRVFADGSVIEFVAIPDSNEPGLILWEKGKIKTGPFIEHQGTLYRPALAQHNKLGSMLLPHGVRPYGSKRKLCDSVGCTLNQYLPLSSRDTECVTQFVLHTYVADAHPFSPVLHLLESPNLWGVHAVRLLRALCYHAISFTNPEPKILDQVPTALNFTFIAQTSRLSPAFERLIGATRHQDAMFRGARGLVARKFPAVLFTHSHMTDPNLEVASLRIHLPSSRSNVPRVTPEVAARIASDLQPMLLDFRLKNFGLIRKSQFDLPELQPATRELAYALCAVVSDDPDLRPRITGMFEEIDEDYRAAQSQTVEAVVAECAFLFAHDEGRADFTVGELTECVNVVLRERGESNAMKPKAVGWKMNGIGLRTISIGSKGRGLRLSKAQRTRIHDIARHYNVRSLFTVAKPCALCLPVMSEVGSHEHSEHAEHLLEDIG